MSIFNNEYVAYTYNERGYYLNEFATRLDMSGDTVEQFLDGTVEPGDLRVGTLVNMANLLGIPLHSMFAQPGPPPDADNTEVADADADSEEGSTLVADAEQLVACIYDNGRTPTLMSETAKAFGWTMDRVKHAADEANRRLRPAGLTLSRSHSELTIVPVNNHVHAQKALTARKVNERGLTYTHYRAVYQLQDGKPVTVNKTAKQRRLTLGGLVNLGVVTGIKNPALTDAAQEAFL